MYHLRNPVKWVHRGEQGGRLGDSLCLIAESGSLDPEHVVAQPELDA